MVHSEEVWERGSDDYHIPLPRLWQKRIWRFDCEPKGSGNCQSDFWPLSDECRLVKDWGATWLPGRENGDGNNMGKRDHQWDALQWKVQRGFSSAEVVHPWKQKKPYKEKQRGSAELLHFGKSRTNCIAGDMGKGAGSQGTEKTWQKYRTGQHNEVPKPLSLKRNADLPLLRKNTPAQSGLQEENPMALQHLHWDSVKWPMKKRAKEKGLKWTLKTVDILCCGSLPPPLTARKRTAVGESPTAKNSRTVWIFRRL